MPNVLDIDILPLFRRWGKDQPELPGFKAVARPRRAARGRETDQLVIYMDLSGSLDVSPEQQEQILTDLARTYYSTSGSITSALRDTAEALNNLLMRRNLQHTGSAHQVVGSLSLLVLRGEQLFLSQSGLVTAYFLSGEQTQILHDSSLSGRGLGSSQSTPLRYFQTTLQATDTLILAARPAAGWDASLIDSLYGQGFESQRQLLASKGGDFSAAVFQFKSGSGKVNLLKVEALSTQTLKPVTPLVATPMAHPEVTAIAASSASPGTAEIASPSETAQIGKSVTPHPSMDLGSSGEGVVMAAALNADLPDDYQPLPEIEYAPSDGYISGAGYPTSVTQPVGADPQVAERAGATSSPAQPKTPRRGFMVRVGAGLALVARPFARALSGLFGRLLPEESIAKIPNSVMAFTALAIPLVIVVAATTVYLRQGLAAKSDQIYNQSLQAVEQAQAQTDPQKRREALTAALIYLDLADEYNQRPETQTMRVQVQSALDELDLVRRIDYKPAIIGGLKEGTLISRLVVVDTDLYLLNSANGEVLRAIYTNQGYEIDQGFACGPESNAAIGPLVDMRAWTASLDPFASIIGIDAQGTLLYCFPDAPPQDEKLPGPADKALGNISSFALNYTDLYLVDPSNSTVWVYWNGDFENPPAAYLGEQPLALQDVVDLAVSNEELYLLHADGRMTLCLTSNLGSVSPNRCADPAPYLDMRVGRENTTMSVYPTYSRLEYSPPPDPSLFLLVGKDQVVDRFSLRNLAYQRRFGPVETLPGGDATAFTVDNVERVIYLAVANQVYYATVP